MNALVIIVGILLMLCSIALIVLVMFQEQKGKGLSGAIGGDSGAMFEGRFHTSDEKMAKLTKYLGIAFFVLVVLEGVLSLLK